MLPFLLTFSVPFWRDSINFLQREELRARFPGLPGDLVNYFLYVAEEVIGIPFSTWFHGNFCHLSLIDIRGFYSR